MRSSVIKLIVLAACMLCLLLPALAMADSGCPWHPDAQVKVYTGTDCVPDGGRGHIYYQWSRCACAVCGYEVYPDAEHCYYRYAYREGHMGDSYCIYCGFDAEAAKHECDIPTPAGAFANRIDRQDDALMIGSRANGGTAVIVESGNARSLPSARSAIVGKVKAGQSYQIVSTYTVYTGNGATWYQIMLGNRSVWVSAALVHVVPATNDVVVDT